MSGSVCGGVSSEGKAAISWLSFMARIVHQIWNAERGCGMPRPHSAADIQPSANQIRLQC
jgi:hypothetical protein